MQQMVSSMPSCFLSTILVAWAVFFVPESRAKTEKDVILGNIPLGSKLSASEEDYWVSRDGTFAMGFFSKHQDGIYSVGIWYNSIPKDAQPVVWTAGEDVKVSLNSTFELCLDGNLFLIDGLIGYSAWTSNTSSKGVVGASLQENGNFLLIDSHNKTVWESFRAPTDTLLPGQRLEMNESLRASSRTSIANYYTLAMEGNGSLELRWCEDTVYWDSGTGAKRLNSEASFATGASFLEDGVLALFDEERKMVWSRYSRDFTDQSVTLRRLRLDTDGNLRMYSWIEAMKMWVVGWQAVNNQCDVFATCGLYGMCSFNSTGPYCVCPFEMRSSSVMLSENGANRSCYRQMTLGSCNEGNTMLVLKATVLYGIYPPQDIYNYSSADSCRDNCLKDSTCVAATAMNDGSGICRIKSTIFIGGYGYASVPAISFLKVCLSPQAVPHDIIDSHRHAPNSNSLNASQSHAISALNSNTHDVFGIYIGLSIMATVCAFLVIQVGISWFVFRRRAIRGVKLISSTNHQLMDPCSKSLLRLTYAEIEEITENFSHQLGPTVFKGTLPNGNHVVIKQLGAIIPERDFRNAYCILGSTRHRNLVCLHGFCCEEEHRLIAYEYVNNGSLEQWLFGCTRKGRELNWQRRFGVIVRIARAIAYLHSDCHDCIAHSNLKLENVMLDNKFMAKVTDFGLSRLSLATSSESTSCSESYPEQDICNFGLMLLEIISGKRDPKHGCSENEGICKWAFQEYQNGHLDRIVDSRMEGNVDWNQVERTLRIAFWCIQGKAFLRPCVREVVAVLEGTCPVDPPPILQSLAQGLHAGALDKLKQLAVEKEEIDKEEDNEEEEAKVAEKQCNSQLATTSCGNKAN